MNIYIGIDPSINSTGICKLICDDNDNILNEEYFIIYPSKNKLTKKQKAAEDKIDNFKYIQYDAVDLKDFKDDYFVYEKLKTENIINLMSVIDNIVNADLNNLNINLYVLQEGISYGSSLRTKSIFDLAGINFLLRSLFIGKNNINFTISPPANIKKFITGKGNSKKDIIIDMFLSTHQKLKDIPKIDDIADAYYMALYAKKIKGQS